MCYCTRSVTFAARCCSGRSGFRVHSSRTSLSQVLTPHAHSQSGAPSAIGSSPGMVVPTVVLHAKCAQNLLVTGRTPITQNSCIIPQCETHIPARLRLCAEVSEHNCAIVREAHIERALRGWCSSCETS